MCDVTSDEQLRFAKFDFQPKLETFKRHGNWTKQTTKNVRSEKQSRERASKSEAGKASARVQSAALSQHIPARTNDPSQAESATPVGPVGILNLDLQGQAVIEQFASVDTVISDEEPYIIVDSAGVKDMSQNRAVKMKGVLTTLAGV